MLKQIFVINQDLKMGKGKIAVQVAHGEVYYMNTLMSRFSDDYMNERFSDWFIEDRTMMKVVLKTSEITLYSLFKQLTLKDIWCKQVHDMGYTQVPKNSFTCLVVEPLPEEQADELFSHLKLL